MNLSRLISLNFLFLILFYQLPNAFGQLNKEDSLKIVLKTAMHDSTKVNVLFELMELSNARRSYKIRKQIDDKAGIAISLNNLATLYFLEKKYHVAFAYSDSSLTLAKELGFPEQIRNAENSLSLIDSARGNYAGAFEHYRQFVIYRDSISNKETRKMGIKNQLKYEYEKKEAVITEQQKKERSLAGEKSRRQQIVIWSVVFGLLLVVVFALFVFRTLKTTRSQKKIIEEKQKEILDSIHYAKRIQTALITNEKYIDKTLKRLNK